MELKNWYWNFDIDCHGFKNLTVLVTEKEQEIFSIFYLIKNNDYH